MDIMRANSYANIVGNVLCRPGCDGAYLFGETQRRSIYRLGYRSDGDSDHAGVDPEVATTLLRFGNYDFVTGTVRWDHEENVAQPSTRDLPASLYLDESPPFFESLAWPPFGPEAPGSIGELPAKACYENHAKHGNFDAERCYYATTDPTEGGGDGQEDPEGGDDNADPGGGEEGCRCSNAPVSMWLLLLPLARLRRRFVHADHL